jgi:hypothetical protein
MLRLPLVRGMRPKMSQEEGGKRGLDVGDGEDGILLVAFFVKEGGGCKVPGG